MKTIRAVAAVIRKKDYYFTIVKGNGNYKDKWKFPGGKIEEGETPQQALVREIKEELDTDIEVGELIDTIEYDYPTFHLSMNCYWAKIVSGNLNLKEVSASKWLTREQLDSVDWLPADITLISTIKNNMRVREMLNRKVSVEKLNESSTNELWGEDIQDFEGNVTKWCYTDVLYSFKSMYLLGIKSFYPDLVDVCGMTLRPAKRTSNKALAYSEDFILSCGDRCGNLNDYEKLQAFIDCYETIGNVIPVWPGANVHRGQFGCYDCPDIYFNDQKISKLADAFFGEKAESNMFGEKSIIAGRYKKITVHDLVNMNRTDYVRYISHALNVIKFRMNK